MHLLIAHRKNEEEIGETHAIWRQQVLGYYNTAQAHRYIDQWRYLLAPHHLLPVFLYSDPPIFQILEE